MGTFGADMSLRSNMWSSGTLADGVSLARAATLSLESDLEAQEMRRELIASCLH